MKKIFDLSHKEIFAQEQEAQSFRKSAHSRKDVCTQQEGLLHTSGRLHSAGRMSKRGELMILHTATF